MSDKFEYKSWYINKEEAYNFLLLIVNISTLIMNIILGNYITVLLIFGIVIYLGYLTSWKFFKSTGIYRDMVLIHINDSLSGYRILIQTNEDYIINKSYNSCIVKKSPFSEQYKDLSILKEYSLGELGIYSLYLIDTPALVVHLPRDFEDYYYKPLTNKEYNDIMDDDLAIQQLLDSLQKTTISYSSYLVKQGDEMQFQLKYF